MRTGSADIAVEAPGKFLRAMLDWCDGTASVGELESRAQAKWGSELFGRFLSAMLAQGILVEGTHRHFHAMSTLVRSVDRAEQPSPEVGVVLGASHPLNSLAGALLGDPPGEGRAGQDLSTARRHGAPIRACLTLGAVVPQIFPGTYVVTGTAEAPLLSKRDGVRWADAQLAFRDPYELMCGTAVVILWVDLRDSETASDATEMTRSAFLSAGAAFQRATDACQAQGWVLRVLNKFDAARLARVSGCLPAELLGAAVVKPMPVRASANAFDANRRHVVLHWAPPVDGLNQHIVGARVEPSATHSIGWGRSLDPSEACAKAVSEAVERWSYREASRALVWGEGVALDAPDPRDFVRFSRDQYARGDLRVVPYDPGERRLWTDGVDHASGARVWVPAECVFHPTCLPDEMTLKLLMRTSSSGCASDTCLETAIGRAASEVIERDALARHWLSQRPCREITSASLPEDIREKMRTLASTGLTVDLGLLQAGFGPVVVAGLTSEDRGFCAVGTACRATLSQSIEAALSEAEVAAFARLARTGSTKAIAPRSVRSPDEHGRLFAQRRYFRRAHALLQGGPPENYDQIHAQWPRSWTLRMEQGAAPSRLVWVDLSSGDAPLSLDGKPISTVRALIAGAIPMAFGYDALPRGMGSPSVAAGRFPHPLP